MGKRTERKLLSIVEEGGIVTVKYAERTYTDADAWLKENCVDEDRDTEGERIASIAIQYFPNSAEFPVHSAQWAVLNLLFVNGPLFEHQIRDAMRDVPLHSFNKALDMLLADGIVYRDVSGVHIDQEWLENYIDDFLAMPGGLTDENI